MQKPFIWAMLVVFVGAASFYGGMTYAKSATPAPARAGFGNGQFAAGGPGTRTARTGGGFTTGEILSKDATSVTVKLPDGSTKIVLMGTSTQVVKSTTGSATDLTTGTNVIVTGASNSDGSVTAQNIQIRPAGMGGPGLGGQRAQGQ
jgi:hypothetical protein